MDKKIKGVIAYLVFFSGFESFATEKNEVFDQSRYNEIVKLYEEKKIMANNITTENRDIVNAHINQLRKKLKNRMALAVWVQASLMGGFAGLAGLAGLASFEGAIGIPGVVKRYEVSTGPAAARILWATVTLGSLISAKITQYLYRSRDAFTYFAQSLHDEIAQDEAILKALDDAVIP